MSRLATRYTGLLADSPRLHKRGVNTMHIGKKQWRTSKYKLLILKARIRQEILVATEAGIMKGNGSLSYTKQGGIIEAAAQ